MRWFLVPLLVLLSGIAMAQDAPTMTTIEIDLGIDCPEAQALSPDGTVLYVLMAGCVTGTNRLLAFSMADGTPVDIGGTYSEQLAVVGRNYVNGRENAMAFTPDGLLSFMMGDQETSVMSRLLLPLSDNADTPAAPPDESIGDVLAPYLEFYSYRSYSSDHRMVAGPSFTAMNVISLDTGEVLFSLPVEEGTYNAYPVFAPDNTAVYVPVLDNWYDYTTMDTTVSVYSLPNGELLTSFASPSPFLTPSPDGTMAIVPWGSDDGMSAALQLFNLETGTVSDSLPYFEEPRPLTSCTNDGRSINAEDVTVSGAFGTYGITWRPDSSGFLFTRSYYGEGLEGDTLCTFNTSRLNVVNITRGEN